MSASGKQYSSRVECSKTGRRYTVKVSTVGTFECPGCDRVHKVA